MSEFRLPAALKVRTIKVAGIVRRHCDLGPIWGRNTAEVEKVHTQKRAQPISSLQNGPKKSVRARMRACVRKPILVYRMGLIDS